MLISIININFKILLEIYEKIRGIINICSSSSYNGGGTFGHTIYSSSKHALLGFSKALDEEYRKKNIRVGTISPAGVVSGMTKNRKDIKKNSLISLNEVTRSIIYLITQKGKGIIYELRLWRMYR